MRDIKNKLTSSKNSKNIQTRKGKSFGYQVLGFGADNDVFEPGTAQYLVIAGGGGGGGARGGGGGAGGFRTASCLAVEGGVYAITVGAGGTASRYTAPYPAPRVQGTRGSDSIFSAITSSGGGNAADEAFAGTPYGSPDPLFNGGSGGGGDAAMQTLKARIVAGDPSQGNSGGAGGPSSSPGYSAGGGGGAGAVGTGGAAGAGGAGGAGGQIFTGSAVTYAGGGGGGNSSSGSSSGGSGGGGGGGNPNGIAERQGRWWWRWWSRSSL